MQKQAETYHLRFSECIDRLEREISPNYIPGAIAWVDAIYDGAYSKALNRLERSLEKLKDRIISDRDFAVEQSLFFDTVTEYFQKYRTHKKLDESEQFLKSFFKGDYK